MIFHLDDFHSCSSRLDSTPDNEVGDVGVTHDLANVGELLLCRNQLTVSCHDAHGLRIDKASVDARLSAIQGLGEDDRGIV